MSIKVVIVGKANCPRCDQAKQLSKMNNISFDYKRIHEDILIENLEKIVGGRVSSVPQVYLSENGLNTYIGGYKEYSDFVAENSFDDHETELQVL